MSDFDNTPPVAIAINQTPSNTAPVAKTLSGFTPDNTAPAAMTIDQAPSNTAPVAIAISQTPDNTAPTAKTLAGFTPDNNAPGAMTISQTPDNTAPVPKALSGFTPDDTAPAAKTIDQAPSNAAPTAIAISQTPDNTAPTAKTLSGFTPDNTAPVGIVTDQTPNNEAPRLRGALHLSTPNDQNVNTPILKLEGVLVLNQTFGQTRIAAASALARIQIALEEPPVGGPCTVVLVDSNGTPYGVSVTVADGQKFGETILDTPLPLLVSANVIAKATVVGVTKPGGFGVVTLFLQLGT